jgi:glutamate synthase domain-containing protein 3
MAGGVLVALGMDIANGNGNPHNKVSDLKINEVVKGSLGTGIHGGAIYIRGEVPRQLLGVGATVESIETEDKKLLEPILNEFCHHFKVPYERIWKRNFSKVTPASSRPFGSYYNYRSV